MRQEGILGNWALDTLTPKDLEDATDNLIKKATDQYDKVGSLKPEELNIENCVQVNIVGITRYQNAIKFFILASSQNIPHIFHQALLNVECILMNEEGPIDFPQHAVSNKELRDASVAAAKKLNAFNVRLGYIWLTSVV